MTYGQVQGVSNTMLHQQRQAVASAGAPGGGTQRQSVDLALLLLDGPHGRVDPAHQAHAGPIGDWAKAIWHKWIELPLLQGSLEKARVELHENKRPWARVKGPAGALIATAHRLGWKVVSATELVTDFAATALDQFERLKRVELGHRGWNG